MKIQKIILGMSLVFGCGDVFSMEEKEEGHVNGGGYNYAPFSLYESNDFSYSDTESEASNFEQETVVSLRHMDQKLDKILDLLNCLSDKVDQLTKVKAEEFDMQKNLEALNLNTLETIANKTVEDYWTTVLKGD